MPFLLLLLLTLTCLQGRWPQPPSWLGPADLAPIWSTLATWLGIAPFLVLASSWSRQLKKRILTEPEHRSLWLQRYTTLRWYHSLGLVAFYLIALYGLGWGWTVKYVLSLAFHRGSSSYAEALPPGLELIALAPFLTGLILSWSHFYDVERAAHATSLIPEQSSLLGRWAYVALQARNNLLLIVPPLLLLMVRQIILHAFPEVQRDERFLTLFTFGLLAAAFISIPWLLRWFLGLRSLPAGPLRDRLLAAGRRLRFRCNDILLWNTRDTVANAMVTGTVPFLRYVVLTDRLIRDLNEDEIEAVFGHEVGHVKHHHMSFYIVFLLVSLLAISGMWKVGVALAVTSPSVAEASGAPLVRAAAVPRTPSLSREWEAFAEVGLVAGYIFLVFGFLSRRCERQADLFGCHTVSFPAFIGALERVAVLNGIHRERPGWLSSWLHGTIGQRVGFLRDLEENPLREKQFQRRLFWLKWGVVVGLMGLVVALCLIIYTWQGPAEVWAILKSF